VRDYAKRTEGPSSEAFGSLADKFRAVTPRAK
jgi:hypothetical protein